MFPSQLLLARTHQGDGHVRLPEGVVNHSTRGQDVDVDGKRLLEPQPLAF